MSTDDSQEDPFGQETPFDDDNPFGDNPYASPDLESAGAPVGPMPYYPPPASRGMVKHVPVLAILMIVQGALEVLMGLGLIGMGAFIPLRMLDEMAQHGGAAGGGPPGPSLEAMTWLFGGMYGGMGVVVLIGAVLYILAGIRNYKFRGRVLGIVALIAGMVTWLLGACYCAPTAIALGVYGLICFLNPEVTHAFAMGAAGKKKDEILATFG